MRGSNSSHLLLYSLFAWCMIICCCFVQLFVSLFRHVDAVVALAAGEVQGNLRLGESTIFSELADLVGINCHEVGLDVAAEAVSITQGALCDFWHVAGVAGHK